MPFNFNLLESRVPDPTWRAQIQNAAWFQKWSGIVNADASTAFASGMQGKWHLGTVIRQATGMGYVTKAMEYYAQRGTAPGLGTVLGSTRGTYTKNVQQALAEGSGAWAARVRAVPGAGRTAWGSAKQFAKHRGVFLGALGSGLVPGFAILAGINSEHGFGVGFAQEVAGFATWGMGTAMGMHMGGWAGASAAGPIARLATKVTGAKSIGTGIRYIGGTAGLGIGFLAGGLIAFEAARWTVGFALHTLPTFSRLYQADIARQGFGSDYTDSAGAATMRQRSLQVMGRSFANARSALGQEAALLHI